MNLASPTGPGDLSGTRFPTNVVRFARLLRRAEIRVGTGQILEAVRALAQIDISSRSECYWALHATLLTAETQSELFRQLFDSYWRDPLAAERALSWALPTAGVAGEERPRDEAPFRRVADAWTGDPRVRGEHDSPEEPPLEVDAFMSWSAHERLRHRDFEQMSAEELRVAFRLINRMALGLRERPTRRFRPVHAGVQLDLRRTFRAALRTGGQTIPLRHRTRRMRPPPLVVLCDVSGSMERYARVMLQFLHATCSARDRVESFVFGTRLTRITRALRHRDVDVALRDVGHTVEDWSGGTRIGNALEEFNRLWSRRVLGQGAVVLLISDGLDREAGVGMARAAARLRRSCRRFIWLNPLLRFEGFEPRAAGVRALLPHVDEHRPVHDLNSLEALVEALTASPSRTGLPTSA